MKLFIVGKLNLTASIAFCLSLAAVVSLASAQQISDLLTSYYTAPYGFRNLHTGGGAIYSLGSKVAVGTGVLRTAAVGKISEVDTVQNERWRAPIAGNVPIYCFWV